MLYTNRSGTTSHLRRIVAAAATAAVAGVLSISGTAQAAPAATTSPDLDWNGDGFSDILAINFDNAKLYTYDGNENLGVNYGFGDPYGTSIGTGWGQFLNVARVSNWPSTVGETILAVATDGTLLAYPSNGRGGFQTGSSIRVGQGWNRFSTVLATTNFAGDGLPDVLGVQPDGDLYLYERGANGWVNPNGVRIGTGFDEFDQIVAMRWTNSGHIGLVGHGYDGTLRFYEGNGTGGFANGTGVRIGQGFRDPFEQSENAYQIVSVGDWNGDGAADLMTLDGAGDLVLYEANGTGGWLNPYGIQIGTGFEPMRLF